MVSTRYRSIFLIVQLGSTSLRMVSKPQCGQHAIPAETECTWYYHRLALSSEHKKYAWAWQFRIGPIKTCPALPNLEPGRLGTLAKQTKTCNNPDRKPVDNTRILGMQLHALVCQASGPHPNVCSLPAAPHPPNGYTVYSDIAKDHRLDSTHGPVAQLL